MPALRCTNCGRITNTTTSNYWLNVEIDGETPKEVGKATGCYAAFVDERWVKGCAYGKADQRKKALVDKLLVNLFIDR